MKYEEACRILGVDAGTSAPLDASQLKTAFKRAALKHHPDKNPDNVDQAKELFQGVTKAYNFLTLCVERGHTGPNQPRFATADQYDEAYNGEEEEEEDDDEYYDDEDEAYQDFLFQSFFQQMHHGYGHPQGRGSFGGGGNRSSGAGGMGFGFRNNAGHAFAGVHVDPGYYGNPYPAGHRGHAGFAYGGTNYSHYDYHRGAENNYPNNNNDDDVEVEIEDFFDRMQETARRREEERRQAKAAKEAHAAKWAEKAKQAALEGRAFFESWNIKQLRGECQRRGISIKGMQQAQIVEALIAEESKKRLRDQLKQEAPLLDEWAEVIHMKRADMNGMKVRVIDFFDGTI